MDERRPPAEPDARSSDAGKEGGWEKKKAGHEARLIASGAGELRTKKPLRWVSERLPCSFLSQMLRVAACSDQPAARLPFSTCTRSPTWKPGAALYVKVRVAPLSMRTLTL